MRRLATSSMAETTLRWHRAEIEERIMPKKPIERAREDEREGKAPSTQAGEFVREKIDLIRRIADHPLPAPVQAGIWKGPLLD